MSRADERERLEAVELNLLNLLKDENITAFREDFLIMHSYEQAKFYATLEKDQRLQLYQFLSPGEMAYIFENLEVAEDEYQQLLSEMHPTFAADMLAQMYTDDAVDVLNELDQAQVASYLTIMNNEAAQEIKELLHYEEYTAGSIMTTEFIAIHSNQTVSSAMQILKKKASEAEIIYYVYVVDQERKLAGVLSLRDLLIAEDHNLISDVMHNRLVSVSVAEDQEAVAKKMKDYNFLALPVVDFQNHLLGIITVDDVLDVIDEEASDDYSKLAAVSDVDRMDKGPFTAAKKRLPWLIILLFLGMMTASLIGRFEDTLNQVAILAVFIPLIAGMAGNTGTQALAVAVRGLATGDIEDQSKWKLIAREAGTGIITGSICGILVMVVVYVWQGDLFLGLLVGISIFMALIVATLAGALVPLIMYRLKVDPAVASGPFITTINDLISIFIYFSLATLFMKYLH